MEKSPKQDERINTNKNTTARILKLHHQTWQKKKHVERSRDARLTGQEIELGKARLFLFYAGAESRRPLPTTTSEEAAQLPPSETNLPQYSTSLSPLQLKPPSFQHL